MFYFEKPLKDQQANDAATKGDGASIVVLGLFVAGTLIALLGLQYWAAEAMGNLATWLPIGYAVAAGMVASVNPCGFFLLPAYVSYQLGTEEKGYFETPALQRLSRALLLGAVATAGFVAVFSVIGYGISRGGWWLVSVFPYAGVVIGVALAGLGAYLLFTGKSIGIAAAGRVGVTPRKNLANVFLFGAGYAVCSLSCTLPVFLVVVGSALASKGFAASLTPFLGYSLGMGSVLIAVTVGAALFKGAVARFVRRAMPYVHTAGAMFLVAAGLYVVYYWLRTGQAF